MLSSSPYPFCWKAAVQHNKAHPVQILQQPPFTEEIYCITTFALLVHHIRSACQKKKTLPKGWVPMILLAIFQTIQKPIIAPLRPRRWSIFRAMRCRWFIFQQRCDTDYFLEKLNIAIVAIIFLDHRERLFFDYFAHFRTNYFAIIHWLTGITRKEAILEIRCSVTCWLCTTG